MADPGFVRLPPGVIRGAAPPGPHFRGGGGLPPGAIPIPPPPPGGPNQPQRGPQQPPAPPPPRPERKQPSRVVGIHDLRGGQASDAMAVFEELTTYEVVTLRKADPTPDERKLSWERIKHIQEPPLKKDVIRQILHLDRKDKTNKTTVTKRLTQLYPHQDAQVNNVVNTFVTNEKDNQFTWDVRQMDKSLTSKPLIGWGSRRQTKTITLYLRRAPCSHLDPVAVRDNLEKARKKEEKEREKERKDKEEKEQKEEEARRGAAQRAQNPHQIPAGLFIPPPHPSQLPQAAPAPRRERSRSRDRRNRRRDRSRSTSETSSRSSPSDSDTWSWDTSTESRTSGSRDSRRARPRHRSHRRPDPRYFADDIPQLAYQPRPMLALPMAREQFLDDYIPRGQGRPVVHQRPMDDVYLAQRRREEEQRRASRDVRDFLREAPMARMERRRDLNAPRFRDRRFSFNGFYDPR